MKRLGDQNDAVDAGITGLLCAPRDGADLALQMRTLLQMQPQDRSRMGLAGRRKMEQQFDERVVIAAYLNRIAGIENYALSRNAS